LIANHLVKAGRPDEALDYFQGAAQAAAAKYANEEAADLYQQALQLTPEGAVEKRFSIFLTLENIWNVIGDRAAQAKVLDSLASAADRLADPHKQAEVLLRRAWFFYWTGDFPKMQEATEQVISLSEHIRDPGLTQRALYAWTWFYSQIEDFDRAEEKANRALELALQAGNRMEEGNVHNVLGRINMAQGRYAQARTHIENFLTIAHETENQSRELTALNNLVAILIILGEYKAAREYGLQMLNLAIEIGDRMMESTAYINLAWGTSALEDWRVAEGYVLKGLDIKREIHQLDAMAEGLVWLGHIKLGLHQPAEAERAFRESLDIRRGLEQESLQAESISGLSLALLASGDLAGAGENVQKIIEFIGREKDLSGAWEPLRIYWTCYQVFQASGDARANQILKDAVNILTKIAEKIPDKKARERFLTNVHWHHEIMAAWKRVHQ
jgi:tetratricopeptide (TPR) repeat protein